MLYATLTWAIHTEVSLTHWRIIDAEGKIIEDKDFLCNHTK